eukprot:GHVU01037367.1.p1 GENE.GHVU01037367.1~~GHVU01037367.1.p1  ORF type:complete len:320 (-),score=58.02 GHVU01037367.1:984-1943(-)
MAAPHIALPLPPTSVALLSELKTTAAWEYHPTFVACLVRIIRHMELKGVHKLRDVCADLFAPGGSGGGRRPAASSPSSGGGGGGGGGGQAAVLNVDSITATLQTTAGELLSALVFKEGVRLSAALRTSFFSVDWRHCGPPKQPRAVVCECLREATRLDDVLAKLFGDPRKRQMWEPHQRRVLLGRYKLPMETEVERLIAAKTRVYCLATACSRTAVVKALLQHTLRSAVEDIRRQTFNKEGVRQVQLDGAFMVDVLRDIVEEQDIALLEGCVDEMVVSAVGRCVEGGRDVLTEPSATQRFVDNFRSFKFHISPIPADLV